MVSRRRDSGCEHARRNAALLGDVRAALAAGAAPGAAFAAAVERVAADAEPLASHARAVRLGSSLADVAQRSTGDQPTVELMLRALAVVERCGAGGLAAVDQALTAAAEEAEAARRLRARTAQARGTAVLLTVLPVVAWLLLVVVDARSLAFYATAPGVITAVIAVLLWLAGHQWLRRIVERAEQRAWQADPLWPPSPSPDLARAATLGIPALVVAGLGAGPQVGVLAGAALACIGLRQSGPAAPDFSGGGAAEAIELVAVALACGQGPAAAVAMVAPLAPPAARNALADAARRLAGGWSPAAAFAGGGLAELGEVLIANQRWGAPCVPALRRLAADLRSARRAAGDEAAERTQLLLVFPTTLLTLPAFVVAVVPPLVWTAFTGAFG